MSLNVPTEKLGSCTLKISEDIKKFVGKAKAEGAVIALSGGLDSSVVLVLAKNSGVDIYGLVMPNVGVNNPQDREDAILLAKKLEVPYEVIEINQVVESFRSLYPWGKYSGEIVKTTQANIMPRVRMILNYATANLKNYVVLGTGNRTELLVGYFTKYGDGGVDALPIGGLYKTQVKQLAKFLDIPDAIISKTPSAGLWKGQTDEGELGLSYEELDNVLHNLVDHGKTLSEVIEITGVDKEKVESIKERIKLNAHKLSCPPIFIPLD